MQEESLDPPTHVAVGRVDGKLEVCVEQTFKVISQQQGRRTEVRRSDRQLEWLTQALAEEFKGTSHPAYPRVAGWLRSRTTLNKIPQELRNEILCRYLGCILQYYLRHENIGTKSGELYSAFTSRDDELEHIMGMGVAKKKKKGGKTWFSKMFDFSGPSGVGGCRDRSAVVFYKGIDLVKKNLDMAYEKAKKECGWVQRDAAYLEAIFEVVENFGRCCVGFSQLTKAMAGVGRSLPSHQMEWFLCNGGSTMVANTPKCSIFDKRIQSLMNIKQKTQLHDASPLTARGSSSSSLNSLMVTPRVRTSPMTPRVGTSFSSSSQQKTHKTTSNFSACCELKDYAASYDWTPLPPHQEEVADSNFAHVLSACGRYIEGVQPDMPSIWRSATGPISANLILHSGLSTAMRPVLEDCKRQLEGVDVKIDGCLTEISHVMQTRPGDCFSKLDVAGIEGRAKDAEQDGEQIISRCITEHQVVRRGLVNGLKQTSAVFIKGQIEKAEKEIEAYENVLNLLEADAVDPFDIKDIELPVFSSEVTCYTSTRTPSVASLSSEETDDEVEECNTPSPRHPVESISPQFSAPRPSIVPKLQMSPSSSTAAGSPLSTPSPMGGKKKPPMVQKFVKVTLPKKEEEEEEEKTTTTTPSQSPKRKISVADAFDEL